MSDSGLAFVDSNVRVRALTDGPDASHRKARTILDAGRLVHKSQISF